MESSDVAPTRVLWIRIAGGGQVMRKMVVLLIVTTSLAYGTCIVHATTIEVPEYDITPLHEAAANSTDAAEIKRLVEAGADPLARTSRGNSPLHWGARNSSHVIIRPLIEAGADPHAENAGGMTPLHLSAATNPNPAVTRALIEGGTDVHVTTQRGKTPLHLAAEANGSASVLVFRSQSSGLDREHARPMAISKSKSGTHRYSPSTRRAQGCPHAHPSVTFVVRG